MSDYRESATSDAKEMVREFADQIAAQLCDRGEASADFNNDYSGGDRYHHETHVDRWYNLSDAAEVLGQLSGHRETDSGLWEGQEPEIAIGTQAAFTYGNAVASDWSDLIEKINEEYGEFQPALDELESAYSSMEECGLGLSDFPELDSIKSRAARMAIDEAIG